MADRLQPGSVLVATAAIIFVVQLMAVTVTDSQDLGKAPGEQEPAENDDADETTCVSEYGDVGSCMTSFECRLRKGVRMAVGKEAALDDGSVRNSRARGCQINATKFEQLTKTEIERVCCYLLPCSRTDIRMEVMETVFKLGLHNPVTRFGHGGVQEHVAAFDQLLTPYVNSRAASTLFGGSSNGHDMCGLPYFGPSLRQLKQPSTKRVRVVQNEKSTATPAGSAWKSRGQSGFDDRRAAVRRRRLRLHKQQAAALNLRRQLRKSGGGSRWLRATRGALHGHGRTRVGHHVSLGTSARLPHIVSDESLSRPSRVRFPWLMSLWSTSDLQMQSESGADESGGEEMGNGGGSGRARMDHLVPICAATLIHPWFAVTAAHCVRQSAAAAAATTTAKDSTDGMSEEALKTIFGTGADPEHGRGQQGQQQRRQRYLLLAGTNVNLLHTGLIVHIAWIRVHPKFDAKSFENDVAVIKFVKAVHFSNKISPMCLPAPIERNDDQIKEDDSGLDDAVTDYSGQTVFVAGWGCLSEACSLKKERNKALMSDLRKRPPTDSDWLRHTRMTVIDSDLAMCWFMNHSMTSGTAEYIPSRVFVVAGDESGSRSTCRGDSGASVIRFRPFVHRVRRAVGESVSVVDSSVMRGKWEMIGIVSWSRGCGRPFRPSVWTRVETFVNWIRDMMNIK